jgi:hypothetical protein
MTTQNYYFNVQTRGRESNMASPWDAFFGPARGPPYDLPRAYVGDPLDIEEIEYPQEVGIHVRASHERSIDERPPGGEHFPCHILENVVCDLMLLGWVCLRSPLWRRLNYRCQYNIYLFLAARSMVERELIELPQPDLLDVNDDDDDDEDAWLEDEEAHGYEWVEVTHRLTTSPEALVQWGYDRYRDPRRYGMSIFQYRSGFSHFFFPNRPTFGIYFRRDRERLEREREQRVLWALGPYGPIYGPPATRPPRHELGIRDPRGPTRDEYNRDAKGRVIHVREHCKKKPKPNNVAWQKGRHTGRRCKGR